MESQTKLAPNWNDSYQTIKSLQNGEYKFEQFANKLFPRTWKAKNIKFYHSLFVVSQLWNDVLFSFEYVFVPQGFSQ